MLKGNESSTRSVEEISGLLGGESMEIAQAITAQSKKVETWSETQKRHMNFRSVDLSFIGEARCYATAELEL